ncbi:chromate transporter [Hathewaya massiliensis]|uniref:chromate transporter n=1 Tax=Hathewaya massiliensis TaxID=1964382 RepID=UPI001157DA64|nr:chromate transporter [Hathewaya massiliensis]
MILLKIFLTFFKIGLFSFGGGYAMLPLIQEEVVTINKWLTANEFIDIVAISQVTPGPIAINSATYVGYKASGILGSISATLGVSLPSIIIMLIISKFFFAFKNNDYMEKAFKGLRPCTVGLIAAAAILVAKSAFIDYKSILIFSGAFIASYKYKLDPILLTCIAAILGIILY